MTESNVIQTNQEQVDISPVTLTELERKFATMRFITISMPANPIPSGRTQMRMRRRLLLLMRRIVI